MELIQQKNKSDCGIACIAMLCNKLYEDVEPYFKNVASDGIHPDDILEVIEDLGYDWGEFKRLPKKGRALVALKWKEEGLTGHFIVWDSKRKQFLDPEYGLIDKKDMLDLCEIEYIWKIEK